tara:strand:+ start:5221 stop:5832 length:612 start_codon:yes stop_codon:yes gene_type:complete
MTTAEITYNDGGVYLQCDGNPFVIMIRYEGVIDAESVLPNGFLIQEKNNIMAIIRLTTQEFPEHLFNYTGNFKIKKADLYDTQIKITATFKTNTHHFYRLRDNWDQLNSEWDSYTSDYDYFPEIISNEGQSKSFSANKTDIVTNNLQSTSGKLSLKDGTPYYGDIHFHSNGMFMTGAKHTEDSEVLYKRKKKRIIKNGIARKL